MTNPIEEVKKWLFSIALKKAGMFIAKVIVSIVTGAKVAPILVQLGVTIDPAIMANGIALSLGALLTIGINWAKFKFKLSWL